MERSETVLTLLIHIDSVCDENFRGLVITPDDDTVKCVIAKFIRRIDVRKINIPEIRRLIDAFQDCFDFGIHRDTQWGLVELKLLAVTADSARLPCPHGSSTR